VARIIRDGRIVTDEWALLQEDEPGEQRPHTIVPLARWIRKGKPAPGAEIGVWLNSDEDPQRLVDDLAGIALIALNFPVFSDGRAYSSATMLRRVHGYKGELRAIGDVRRDQMEQMHRCGFNAYQLAEGQDLEAALAGFKLFSHSYQSSVDRPEPLFRLR
jgi:uncharacterized protein (DUF934 family)|tara:strand:+ start:732 stop:1211 length:480 start_codon:yes stop_codon:yes gene_type:complete